MPQGSEPDPPQGLNHSYYNPEEPLDLGSPNPSTSSRRSKSDKRRRNKSPGDNKSRRSSRRDPSPGHGNMPQKKYRNPPPPRQYNSYHEQQYDSYYQSYPPRDAPRSSSHRDDDRRSRPRDYDYPPEPREPRHKSSNRRPTGGQLPRSRHASPEPIYRSSRSIPPDDRGRHQSSHRSHGAEERDGRRSYHSQSRDKAQSRDRGRHSDRDRGGQPKRRNTMPAKTSFWENPNVRNLGKSFIKHGVQAYLEVSKEKGQWVGAKGAKAGLMAIGGAVTDHYNKRKSRR
ncbi:hypothetical protein HDV63DRAFT_279978 [Trichoderma sp. SZMC 28014]